VHLREADPFGRAYCWSVYRPLDLEAMRAAAAVLVGKHDFRAFTAINGKERQDTVRELRKLTVVRRGRRVQITAEAAGFLYKMVRTLAGVLVAVGEGRMRVDDVRRLLQTGVRTVEVQTAPPQGLFLTKVLY
jgi:tRNA pseudouridine38-40 synthase